jgi:hypothetical protein
MADPDMDDMAASQQLLSEATPKANGMHLPTASYGASPSWQFSRLFNSSLKKAPPSPQRIEVPDSQPAPTTTMDALLPSPLRLGARTPVKKMYKKSQRSILSESMVDKIASSHRADAAAGHAESPLHSKSRRRNSHAGTVLSSLEVEHVPATLEQATAASSQPSEVTATKRGVVTPMASYGKRKALTRKNATPEPAQDVLYAATEGIAEDKLRRAQGKLPRVKKSNIHRPQPPVGTRLTVPETARNETARHAPPSASDVHVTSGINGATRKRARETPAQATSPIESDEAEITRVSPSEEDRIAKRSRRTPTNQQILERREGQPTTVLGEDDVSEAHVTVKEPQKKSQPKNPKKKREGHTSPANGRHARKSTGDPSLTAADKALDMVRELNDPLDLRTKGAFSTDEEELIRRAIRDYQERKGISTASLVEVIHWSYKRKHALEQIIDPQDVENANEFWNEIKLTELQRDLLRIKNHIRSRYHCYKNGAWTEEDDEQLRQCYELHPKKWIVISSLIGDRSPVDCFNRWKDYLQVTNRNTSNWSTEEEELLVRAVCTVVQRDAKGRAETDDSRAIDFAKVCAEMGNIRNRLQCLNKWTRLNKRNPGRTPQTVLERDLSKPSGTATEQGKGLTEPGGVPPLKKQERLSSKKLKVAVAEPGQEETKSGEQPKKRRQSKKFKSTMSAEDTPEPQLDTTPVTRSSSPVSPASSTAVMDWSDKFELVDAVMKGNPEQEEDIDWHNVKASLKHTWPLRTLQTAFKTCLDSVDDQGSLSSTLRLVHTSTLMHATKNIDNHQAIQASDDGDEEQERADVKSPHATTKRDVNSPKPLSPSPAKSIPENEDDDQDMELLKSPSPSRSMSPHATTERHVSQSPSSKSIPEDEDEDEDDEDVDVELPKSPSPSPPHSVPADEDEEMDWEPPVQETFNTMDYISESEDVISEEDRGPTTGLRAAKPMSLLDQIRESEDEQSEDEQSEDEQSEDEQSEDERSEDEQSEQEV